MLTEYLERTIKPKLQQAAKEFPVLVLTGPRQAGKTTLLKSLFSDKYNYVSLDLPDVKLAALNDPRGFLQQFPPPVIFDEVQNVPELFPYIKAYVDDHRDQAGQFLLSGSQNMSLSQKVTESLAGRAAILKLLPLSFREMLGEPDLPFVWNRQNQSGLELTGDLWSLLLRGNYPEIATHPDRDPHLWYSSYVQTYLERDLRSIRQIGDLTQFQLFLRAIAARNGQLINFTEISRALGITVNTVKDWLSILEASYQILLLRPYHANVTKRLVKMPKLYFIDIGILSYLVNLSDPKHAAAGPMAESIFETAVLMEVLKGLTYQDNEPEVYFWRTATGDEVDILLKTQGKFIALEVKSSATPKPAMAKGIIKLQEMLPEKIDKAYVVHPGAVQLPLGNNVLAIPFSDL